LANETVPAAARTPETKNIAIQRWTVPTRRRNGAEWTQIFLQEDQKIRRREFLGFDP